MPATVRHASFVHILFLSRGAQRVYCINAVFFYADLGFFFSNMVIDVGGVIPLCSRQFTICLARKGGITVGTVHRIVAHRLGRILRGILLTYTYNPKF